MKYEIEYIALLPDYRTILIINKLVPFYIGDIFKFKEGIYKEVLS